MPRTVARACGATGKRAAAVVGLRSRGRAVVGKAVGPGPRSMEGLAWLGRLDVAGREALRCAMGWSVPGAYSHAQRLAGAGYLIAVYDREGSVLAITRAGRRALRTDGPNLPATRLRDPALRHSRAVSWVAALLTQRDREWISDSEARHDPSWQVPVLWPGRRGSHRPDLGAIVAGQRVAIEVELSAKARPRLDAILAGYEHLIAAGRLGGGVLYISDRADVLAAAQRAAVRAGLPAEHFRTSTLERIATDVCPHAGAVTGARARVAA